ncbi:hypothetical protein [Mesorhizobium sp. A556]
MSPGRALLAEIAVGLAENGLTPRGGFVFDANDEPPPGPSGLPAKSVLLVGQAGGSSWPHFSRWREGQPPGLKNPLDSWSREVIGAVATETGARAVGPNDQPYLPFQQWAMRAEGLKSSPLGILMHPEYGLWHAYRGALLFDIAFDFPVKSANHLCDACVGKPCLKACPVDAYSVGGFAYERCLSLVRGANGHACRTGGCLDRNACPYGTAYRYPAEMQAFHMAAFSR